MSDGATQEQARVDQRDIPTLYNRLARVYDLWAAVTESTARRRALQRANATDGENVLEIAIGTGQTLAALARANPTGTCGCPKFGHVADLRVRGCWIRPNKLARPNSSCGF